MRILVNVNPDFEKTELKWRVSADGETTLVKRVRFEGVVETDFVPEFGPQGGLVIAGDGFLTIENDVATIKCVSAQ